jgi:competence protein ComEA
MKPVKRWLKTFFSLSGSQANGLMLLLPLLLMLIISEPLWRWWHIRHWKPDPRDAIILDSLLGVWQPQIQTSGADSVNAIRKPPVYVKFDPNTATAAELISLGFNERLAMRIENYRRKGGVFRTKNDLLKIYGMDSTLYQHLVRYIDISKKDEGKRRRATSQQGNKMWPQTSKNNTGTKREADRPFDINLADTARLEVLRGIGEKLSRRIIKYRSSLGGFVGIGQLKEVYGLDSVAMEQLLQFAFVAPDFLPDRIDLNTANEKLLEAHPYLNRQEARMIVAYRFQHGRFASVSDLRKLTIFSDEKVRRLEPYLKTVE